jgi:hypothetical protein
MPVFWILTLAAVTYAMLLILWPAQSTLLNVGLLIAAAAVGVFVFLSRKSGQ